MPYVTPQEVAKQIGKPALGVDPIDPKIQGCCDAAEDDINDRLGRTVSIEPVPATINIVARAYAIAKYKEDDATYNVIGAGETGMVAMPRATLDRYDAMLIPFQDPLNGWGVA